MYINTLRPLPCRTASAVNHYKHRLQQRHGVFFIEG